MSAGYCMRCGAVLHQGAAFCGGCGAAVQQAAGPPMVPPPPVVDPISPMGDGLGTGPARRRRFPVLLAIGLIAALAVGGGGFALTSSSDSGRGPETAAETTTTDAPTAAPVELSDSELVAKYGDAVWRVEAEGCDVAGTGTAFTVDEHTLVTNHHVVAFDTSPLLRNRRGETIDGRVVGMSDSRDVAVIKTDASLSPVLSWADASGMSEGDHLLGLGYPVPDLDFTATPGSVLSFKVSGSTREAIRSDGAFDRGNSGGPALNSRGEVVGVITEMALSDGFQNVPLLFTHDVLAPEIETFSSRSDAVESDCSTVAPPPVPDWFDEADWSDYVIDTPPLPPMELPEFVPPVYTPPTTLPCPTGAATGSITSVDAVQFDPQYSPNFYDVTIRGTVVNNASAPMSVFSVQVDVPGYGSTSGFIDSYGELAPGQTATWEATAFVDSPGGAPSASVGTVDWMWGWEYSHC